jgi:glycosyltransferase involved in cell wall biosynthesis
MPVYNAERYVAEALDSVLAQPEPVEVIVVDDGSTDESRAVAERYADRVLILTQPHTGIGTARNAGLEASTGDFIAFLDADDVWPPQRLEAALAAFAADPELDLVFGHITQFVSPDVGEAVRSGLNPVESPQPAGYGGSMLARRRAFERVGPFVTDTVVSEFFDWLLRARELGLREKMLPDTVLARRLHGENNGIRNRSSVSEYPSVLRASINRRRSGEQAG